MTESSAARAADHKGRIPGGYILKARRIAQSEIAHASPCTREVWDWLLLHVNFKSRRCGDTVIRRGQTLTSADKIRDALHWRVGFRIERYTEHQIERAMKWLRERGMIATARATRGMFITVCRYSYYQNPARYEGRSESHSEDSAKAARQEKKETKKENSAALLAATRELSEAEADACLQDGEGAR